LCALAASATAQSSPPVELRILAINDFHGNLKPPPGGIRIDDPGDKGKKTVVPAGGAERMATLVKQLRDGHTNDVFVAAGELIGASPFLSAMFHDEPTIESLSMMGLALSAVGNHEFDEGKDELLRMQNGGCHPEGCKGPHAFEGAKFHYLAASTVLKDSGKTLLPPYEMRTFDGIPVAFIGLTLKGTPEIISPAAASGLEFRDEAETVNALVRDPPRPRILQVSRGFSYAWDAAKPYGEHVDAASMKLNGTAIDPATNYRVSVNDYLALGGDGFAVLKDAGARQYGIYDDEALFAFFGANSPVTPAPPDRISRFN
jgi:2',3'-cyclic-nucleotide 2'-phosphodiesterase (5'-nucleotidase family)